MVTRKSVSIRTQDYPRECGEKRDCLGAELEAMGSPPRVRGKAHQHYDMNGDGGITPACAGKSSHGDILLFDM